MSEVRKFRVKSRLSRFISQPGGISVRDALKRADAGIESLRIPCIADVDATLAEIDSRFAPATPGRDNESLEDLYQLSARIIDVSICLEGSGIDAAARRLCELVDVSQTLGVRDWESIEVHIHALKLLRAAGLSMSDTQRGAVISGLAKVTRKRVGDPNAPWPETAGA